MALVARPASAMATSGSPKTALAYQRLLKPSASASIACWTMRSAVAPPPVSPMRMQRTYWWNGSEAGGDDRVDEARSLGTERGAQRVRERLPCVARNGFDAHALGQLHEVEIRTREVEHVLGLRPRVAGAGARELEVEDGVRTVREHDRR